MKKKKFLDLGAFKEFNFMQLILGKAHIIPLLPCPLCDAEANFELLEEEQVYLVVCSNCNLTLGLPYGYSSRLDAVEDWNKRTN